MLPLENPPEAYLHLLLPLRGKTLGEPEALQDAGLLCAIQGPGLETACGRCCQLQGASRWQAERGGFC